VPFVSTMHPFVIIEQWKCLFILYEKRSKEEKVNENMNNIFLALREYELVEDKPNRDRELLK
jgi:hypothetical protein